MPQLTNDEDYIMAPVDQISKGKQTRCSTLFISEYVGVFENKNFVSSDDKDNTRPV